MHKLLVDIFKEHPGKTVYLGLGRVPLVALDRGTMPATSGSNTPLTPAKLAEIINSFITEEEGAALKRDHYVVTQAEDDRYLRSIVIQCDDKSIDVKIESKLLSDVAAEIKQLEDAIDALGLIKGIASHARRSPPPLSLLNIGLPSSA